MVWVRLIEGQLTIYHKRVGLTMENIIIPVNLLIDNDKNKLSLAGDLTTQFK